MSVRVIHLVSNTSPCYLKVTKGVIKEEMEILNKYDLKLCFKIVRGAYLEKERKIAKINNVSDPINDTYQDTNDNYDDIVRDLINYSINSDGRNYLVIASHNENSVQKAIGKLNNFRL